MLATGAIERPLVFGGNDRPGVMLAGAVRTYVNRFGVVPGGNASWSSPTTTTAGAPPRDLRAAGVEVVAIVDARSDVDPAVREAAEQAGTRIMLGAQARVGAWRHRRSAASTCCDASRHAIEHLRCDLVAMSGGWTPTIHLTTHLGGKPVWDDALRRFVPPQLPPGLSVAGAAAGRVRPRTLLIDRAAAGGRGSGCDCGFDAKAAAAGRRPTPRARGSSPVWQRRRQRARPSSISRTT